jgi:hypothetical protein
MVVKLFRAIIARITKLPMGVREITMATPIVGSGALAVLYADFEALGWGGNSGVYSHSTLFGARNASLDEYHLEPIYDENGGIKAYREVRHKPAKSV